MSEWDKSHNEIRADEHWKSHFGNEKHFASRKYKDEGDRKPRNCRDQLRVGTVIVVRASERMSGRSTVSGYLLAEIVDFCDDESFWSWRTEIVIRILDGSTPVLKGLVGRYRLSVVDRNSYYGGLVMVDVGEDTWINYQVRK